MKLLYALLLSAAGAPLAASAQTDQPAPLPYRSAFVGYQSTPETSQTPDQAWRQANRDVSGGQAMGHTGHGSAMQDAPGQVPADHGKMDHGKVEHGKVDHVKMPHGPMGHGGHGTAGQPAVSHRHADQGASRPDATDHCKLHHGTPSGDNRRKTGQDQHPPHGGAGSGPAPDRHQHKDH